MPPNEESFPKFNIVTIFDFILPIGTIIVASEWMRRIFLSHGLVIKHKSKRFDLSLVLTYIAMILIDLLIYTEVYDLAKLDDFLTILGFVFFASLSCNLLYNYITNRQFYDALKPVRNLDLQPIYGSVLSHFPDCDIEKDSIDK